MQWFRVALTLVLLLLAGTGLAVERHVRQLTWTLTVLSAQQTIAAQQAQAQTALLQQAVWSRLHGQLQPESQ